MLLGYFEISIGVIVKHVRSIGIIGAFCLSGDLRFSVPGDAEEISGLWFGRGISTQVDTMHYIATWTKTLTKLKSTLPLKFSGNFFKILKLYTVKTTNKLLKTFPQFIQFTFYSSTFSFWSNVTHAPALKLPKFLTFSYKLFLSFHEKKKYHFIQSQTFVILYRSILSTFYQK